jgi:hypothetical protein
MFWFCGLLVICWSHCVLTQLLAIDQHTNLMNVYDILGSSRTVGFVISCIHVFFFSLQDATMRLCARDSMHRRIVPDRDCLVLVTMSRGCAFFKEAVFFFFFFLFSAIV